MELKPGYRQTEVGVIPEDWNVKILGDISGRITTGKLDANAMVKSGEFPFFTCASEHYWIDKYAFDCEALLVSGNGANVGYVHYYKGRFNAYQRTYVLSEFSEDVQFIRLFLNRYLQQRIRTEVKAGNTPYITMGTLAEMNISVPQSKDEQCAIATALGDVNALIVVLDQLIAKKRDLKQAAMQELLRPKDGWKRERLGNLAIIQRGASPRPIDSPIWFDDNSPIGWVRISDVTRSGMFLSETTQRLSPLGVQNSRLVNPRSLIMSICATVGRPIITQIETCIHDGFVVFKSLRASQKFLYYILQSIEGDWSKHGQTGSQMNLNTGLINQTEISIPKTKDEQEEIAEVFFSMDTEIAGLEQRRDKTNALKQGMMQELLTGRTRLI